MTTGHEWFTVLSGTARLQLGERVILVEAGRTCYFPRPRRASAGDPYLAQQWSASLMHGRAGSPAMALVSGFGVQVAADDSFQNPGRRRDLRAQ
jgi:hypothetical protein